MFVQLKKDFLGKPAGERIDVADSDGQTLIEQGIAELANPGEAVSGLTRTSRCGRTKLIALLRPQERYFKTTSRPGSEFSTPL